MRVVHLGLTGGIGSGKSTVAGMLAAQGSGVLDADAVSRQSTASNGLAIEAIRQTFGDEFITPEGALDRPRMSALCFSEPAARKKLESIIHPLVQQELQRQARMHQDQGKKIVVWDIPLLVESAHWRTKLDRILVVDCPIETQIHRVMSRSLSEGQPKSESDIRRIIDSQASRDQRLACADWVIFNQGLTLEALQTQVDLVHARALRCLDHAQTGLSFEL